MLLLTFFLFFLSHSCHALEFDKSISVSAAIDHHSVTIFGYSSPLTRVELSGQRTFAVTYSDNSGYFIFDKTLIPGNAGELCLTTIDDNHRLSNPVCLPPLSSFTYHHHIGPVILPPTLTLDADSLKPNSTTVASGQSIPNSQIDIYLFQVTDHPLTFIPAAHALSLPVFTTFTDNLGNYNFSLPTAYSSNYRLFSTVHYLDNFSPKSNTLIYTLPSLLFLFLQQNAILIILLPLFTFTLILFFYFLALYFSPRRYLPAIFSYPLAVYNKQNAPKK